MMNLLQQLQRKEFGMTSQGLFCEGELIGSGESLIYFQTFTEQREWLMPEISNLRRMPRRKD